LSAIRGLDKCHFDFLIGIVYKSDFTVDYAAKLPYDVVLEKATYRAHTNAWILQLKKDLLSDSRVEDITAKIVMASVIQLPNAETKPEL
jgi:hypothetical protein